MLSTRLLPVIDQLLYRFSKMLLNRIRDPVFLDLALFKWELKNLFKIRQISLRNHPLVKVEEDLSELLKWEVLKMIKKNQRNKSLHLVIFRWIKNLSKRKSLLHSVVFQWIKNQQNRNHLLVVFQWNKLNKINLLKMGLLLSQLFHKQIVNYQ